MTAEQFAYWLQGYAELNAEPPSAEQWQSIREHLQAVFVKVTPPFATPYAHPSGAGGVRTDRNWISLPAADGALPRIGGSVSSPARLAPGYGARTVC